MKHSKLQAADEYSTSDHFNDDYEQLSTDYHAPTRSLWFYMKSEPRPCFSWQLLNDLQRLFNKIDTYPDVPHPVEYVIAASGVDGVYNLGGDLESFIHYIRTANSERLRTYGYTCLELGYKCHQQFHRGITSVALIEGSAYGGGFEAALSCNIIIAEESAQVCFPEIAFNLFPGMGAYSYLIRRVAPHVAEKMITSGRVYTGRELYDMGVIDHCARDGEGHQETLSVIAQHRRQQHGRGAMHKAREVVQPVSLTELKHVTDIWVEAALQLDDKALRVMERFARAQQKRKFEKRDNKIINLVA